MDRCSFAISTTLLLACAPAVLAAGTTDLSVSGTITPSSCTPSLSGGGSEVVSVGQGCLIGANAGTGISLGDRCTIEAGLYVTAGQKVAIQRNSFGEVVREYTTDVAGEVSTIQRDAMIEPGTRVMQILHDTEQQLSALNAGGGDTVANRADGNRLLHGATPNKARARNARAARDRTRAAIK